MTDVVIAESWSTDWPLPAIVKKLPRMKPKNKTSSSHKWSDARHDACCFLVTYLSNRGHDCRSPGTPLRVHRRIGPAANSYSYCTLDMQQGDHFQRISLCFWILSLAAFLIDPLVVRKAIPIV